MRSHSPGNHLARKAWWMHSAWSDKPGIPTWNEDIERRLRTTTWNDDLQRRSGTTTWIDTYDGDLERQFGSTLTTATWNDD